MNKGDQEPFSGKFWRIWGIPCCHMIEEKLNKFKPMEAPFKLSDFHHQWHLIVPSAMEKKIEDLKTEELAEQEFKNFGSFFKQIPAFRRRELIGDFYKMFNGEENIDEDIRNTQAGKFSGVAGWLKEPIFGYAIENYLRGPL
ncbi:hypothetical protein BY996DRAFT_6514292 [Phakopsora pachyrhizi]|uniref:Uncharacterized protein n=1 Tax=Phakopsora pachyrhizi TaxID=170000 RepID=A0AAV0BU72_PHAPC|nr:hypothetical protein BY996DRAFT_6514292 [Phakopsora pachyrhizi]CAH7689851.1 hypothetical protein PPACK8108_LOCUS25006 [Phakopsora pachyrhizi]